MGAKLGLVGSADNNNIKNMNASDSGKSNQNEVKQEQAPQRPAHHPPVNHESFKNSLMEIPPECPMHQEKAQATSKPATCPVPHDKKVAEGCPVPHNKKGSDGKPIPGDVNLDNMVI
jgi:hypothetical protein